MNREDRMTVPGTNQNDARVRPTYSACPACGSMLATESHEVCAVCGKRLSEGFQPLDVIRSTYGLQGKGLASSTGPSGLFEERVSLTSNMAWACTVYSMVPYLGILFLPLAFVMGGLRYAAGRRQNDAAETRTALTCIVVSLALLGAQIILWWLLYIIPEIGI